MLNMGMRFTASPQHHPNIQTLVINDFGWWRENEESIRAWIQSNKLNAKIDQQSMVIDFNSPNEAEWFSLVWNDEHG